MSLDVGTLTGTITIEDGVTSSLTSAGKSIDTFSGRLDAVGDKASKLGRDMLPISAAITAVGGASLMMASTFEASMTRLVSVANVGADEIDLVKESILQLALESGVGPQQLADAMTKISSSSSDTTQALEILNVAALGTKAGFGETVQVAGALTAVVNSYASSGLTAARAGDILAMAIKRGGAEATELAPTLANVVPQAAMLGISFEEVAANLATLTNLGVPTTEAVTQLSAVMTALTKETDEGREALDKQELSYEGLRKQAGEEGLQSVLKTLNEAFKGNVTGLTQVFGRVEAVRDIMGTAGVQGKAYEENLRLIKESSDKAGGALKEMAAAMDDTAVQSFAQLKSHVEVLAIKLGDALVPAMKDFIKAAIPVIDKVMEWVQWFKELDDSTKTAIIAVGGAVAIAAPLLIAFGAAASGAAAAFSVLTTAVTVIGGIILALGGPITLAVAIVGGLVYAWYKFTGDWTASFDIIMPPLYFLRTGIQELINLFKQDIGELPTVKGIKKDLPQALGALTTGLGIATGASVVMGEGIAALGEESIPTYSTALADATREVGNLSAITKQQIIDGDKMGASTKEIAENLGLSEAAVKIYLDRVKDSAKDLKKSAEEQEKLKEWIEKTNDEWNRGETSVKDYMKKVTAATDQMVKDILKNTAIQKDAEIELSKVTREQTQSRFNFAMDNVDLWAANEELKLDKTKANWKAAYDAIQALATAQKNKIIADSKDIQAELASMFQGGAGLDPSMLIGGFTSAGGSPVIAGIGKDITDTLTKSLSKLPDILMNAFTGGGGMSGAVSAIGTMVGSGIGEDLGKKLGKSISSIASFAGPLGSAIGALAGPMIEMFTKMLDFTAKGVKSTAEGYGVEVSEALVNAIKKSMEELDMGQQAATIINADKMFPKVDATNFADALRVVHDAFSMVATGQFTVAQGAKVVDDMWTKLAEVGTDASGRISDGMKELIQLNEQYGTQSKEIAKFLGEQATAAGNAFTAISKGSTDVFDKVKDQQKVWMDLGKEMDSMKEKHDKAAESGKLTAEQEKIYQGELAAKYVEMNGLLAEKQLLAEAAGGELENLGMIAVATYGAAVAAGKTHLEALQLVAPGMKDLTFAYEQLGLGIEDAGLKSLMMASTILEENPYLIEAIGGLSGSMIALDNIGQLNADTFTRMQTQGMTMYTKLQAAVVEHGGAAQDALMPMQEYLHAAEEQAIKLGVPLDANTQMLIDQSKELGVWKEKGKTANEQLLEGINKLNDTMSALVANVNGVGSGLRNIPGKVSSDVVITTYNRTGEVDEEGNPIPMAEGGFGTTNKPTLFMTSEDGRPEQFAFSGQGKQFDKATAAPGGGEGGVMGDPASLSFLESMDRTLRDLPRAMSIAMKDAAVQA